MTVQLNNDGTLAITAMSLVEFLPEIEQAIHNGYMLDLEKNEGVPQQYGHMLVLTMYPVGEVEVSEIDTPEDVKVGLDPTPFLAEAPLHVPSPVDEIHIVVQQSQDAVAQAVQDTRVSANSEQPVKVDKVDGRRKKS